MLALGLSEPCRDVAVNSVTAAKGCVADVRGLRKDAGFGAKWCLFAGRFDMPIRWRADVGVRGCCARWMSMPEMDSNES